MISFLSLSVAASSASGQTSKLTETSDSPYKVGQVWRYWTRPNEKGSTFIVLKIEKHPTLHTIVHIAVTGVRLKTPTGEVIEKIPHLPMTETGIESSGPSLVSDKMPLPAYEQAYLRWKQAFDAGQGFVYGATIAGALEELQVSLDRKAPAGAGPPQRSLSTRPSITQFYSPSKNRTDVSLPLTEDEGETTLFGSLMSKGSGVFLAQAHYDYEGASYPPQTGSESGALVFIADRKNAYEDPPRFSISVEGQSIFDGESELEFSIQFDHNAKVVDQWITLRMPRDIFLRVATANKVVIKIGDKSYEAKVYQTKYMHRMAKAILSLGKN